MSGSICKWNLVWLRLFAKASIWLYVCARSLSPSLPLCMCYMFVRCVAYDSEQEDECAKVAMRSRKSSNVALLRSFKVIQKLPNQTKHGILQLVQLADQWSTKMCMCVCSSFSKETQLHYSMSTTLTISIQCIRIEF